MWKALICVQLLLQYLMSSCPVEECSGDQSNGKLVLRLERKGMLAWILNTGGGLSKMRGCTGLGYWVIKRAREDLLSLLCWGKSRERGWRWPAGLLNSLTCSSAQWHQSTSNAPGYVVFLAPVISRVLILSGPEQPCLCSHAQEWVLDCHKHCYFRCIQTFTKFRAHWKAVTHSCPITLNWTHCTELIWNKDFDDCEDWDLGVGNLSKHSEMATWIKNFHRTESSKLSTRMEGV